MSLVHVEYPASCDHAKNSEQGGAPNPSPFCVITDFDFIGIILVVAPLPAGIGGLGRSPKNMTLRPILALLIIVSPCLAVEKWTIGVVPKDKTLGHIAISQDGFDSLTDAVLQFPKQAPQARLTHIWIGLTVDHDALAQKEIMSYLQQHYPKELKAATESAGNMHNPKVIPLRKPFEEALLSTTFVKNLQVDLAKIGYEVSGVSTEKFTFVKQTNSFSAATWLMTKKKAEQTGPANPHAFGTFVTAPADSASRAGAVPKASGDT